MQRYFDYSKGKVDKSNKDRIIFISRMAYLMQELDSTSEEVNELINWLYCKSEGLNYHESDLEYTMDYKLEPIKWLDNKRAIKEVWENDVHLYSYALMLHDFDYWTNKDVLTDIISEMYFRLDKIVHPYEEDQHDRDLEDIRYFVEFDYIDEEQ